MKLHAAIAGAASLLVLASVSHAAQLTVTMNAISAEGIGAAIGSVVLTDTRRGLLIEPDLRGLPAGAHGFHVHEKPNCGAAASSDGRPAAGLAAGGHYDPGKTAKHRGPHAIDGHLGDLPVLVVDADGTAKLPVLAPRLKIRDLRGRALMIHAGADNYADDPAPLGGGGARIACGVFR